MDRNSASKRGESLTGGFLMTRIRQVLKDIPFLIHLAVYAGVNLLLFIINMLTNPGTIWFVWPLVGWGIGVLGHGILVYLNTKAPPSPRP
jgi:2TM domain